MRVIAAGRASEILDLGDGRVLRRFKTLGDPAREARIMGHARAHGFPAVRVLEVRNQGLVLERVQGPTMWSELRRRPWRAPAHMRLLAELHEQLHRIPYEDARLLHLDLHADNVLLSPAGPVVVDWTNARSGEPELDVALTWVIGATSAGLPGRALTRLFLRHVDRAAARAALSEAAAYRLADRNVTDAERERVRRLLAAEGLAAPGSG